MTVTAILFEPVLLLALGLLAAASAPLVSAPRAASRNLHCAEWPEAGNCSDARGTMWLTGPTALISTAGAALLIGRRPTT